jgi:hypothetical protein
MTGYYVVAENEAKRSRLSIDDRVYVVAENEAKRSRLSIDDGVICCCRERGKEVPAFDR